MERKQSAPIPRFLSQICNARVAEIEDRIEAREVVGSRAEAKSDWNCEKPGQGFPPVASQPFGYLIPYCQSDTIPRAPKVRYIGRVRISSVRFPNAKAKQAPARNGFRRINVK